MIEDVTLRKSDVITADIRFKGGATRTLTVPLPIPLMLSRLTPAETLAALDRLLDTCTDEQAADQLNLLGYHTFTGLPFQATHVSQLRRTHGLKDCYTRLREAGLMTAGEIAAQMG